MRTRTLLLLFSALATATALAGCGDEDGEDESIQAPTQQDGGAAGACLEGTEDCDDTPGAVQETLPDPAQDGY